MPRPLTTERRQELDRLKNARAIREAIYDAAILIGAALLYDDVSKLWPQFGNYIFVVACGPLGGRGLSAIQGLEGDQLPRAAAHRR